MKKQNNQEQDVNILLSEFAGRLNEIEEKQRLLKDRVLLIGENLISTKEEIETEFINLKKQMFDMTYDIKTIKQLNRRIVNELDNFARKPEVEILERQFKMLQPLASRQEHVLKKKKKKQN